MLKKILILFTTMSLLVVGLTACGGKDKPAESSAAPPASK